MSVLRYCCFRWLVYDQALVFEPLRRMACIMMLVWLIYVLELCCDIFPWVPDLHRTRLRAWLVYDWIGGVTWVVGTKDYPGVLSWGQKSKALWYLLRKSSRLKRKDKIILGGEIIGIKVKNALYKIGQNAWVVPKWKERFWGSFYHRRYGKQEWIKIKQKPKTKKGFFLEESKSKKRFLEGKLIRGFLRRV